MDQKKPLVSICLTTYNRGDVLNKTIDSILKQNFTDFELIIHDDNSSDNTEIICRNYLKSDSRIKYFRNVANLKMPGNLNAAIARAEGIYVANLHDGDIYRPDLIQKWLTVIEKDVEILFVFNQYESFDENGRSIGIFDHKLNEINPGTVIREYFYKTLTSGPWGTVLARKEAYEKFGLFDPNYEFISDVEMWMRLSTKGKVGYVSEPIIQLTPREKNHKYYLPDCRLFFINLSILNKYFLLSTETILVTKKDVQFEVKKQLFRILTGLLRRGRFERMREFLFIIDASPFRDLRVLCTVFLLLFGKKEVNSFNSSLWIDLCNIEHA